MQQSSISMQDIFQIIGKKEWFIDQQQKTIESLQAEIKKLQSEITKQETNKE